MRDYTEPRAQNEEFIGRLETELGQEVRGAIERLPVSNIRFRRSQKQGLIPAGSWVNRALLSALARPSVSLRLPLLDSRANAIRPENPLAMSMPIETHVIARRR